MRVVFGMVSFLACLALLAGPAMADEIFSLKAGYLVLSPEGEFAGSKGGVGTRIDMEGDLGFDDSEDVVLEGALQLGSFRLSAGYLPIEYNGNGTLTTAIDFNGVNFPVGAEVDSDVKIDLYDLGLTYYLLNFDDLPVRLQLGPELSVKVADAELSMVEPTTGVQESASITAPIPTIGLRARVAFADFLGATARVGYVEYSDNSFLDADAQVEFSPIPLVGIFGGYRYFDLQVDESDVFLDVQFSGPYAGALVRF